jgi:hypothetical protein
MANKFSILFETIDGKRDYVSLQVKGLGIQVNAGVAELKQDRREELTARIRREARAMIDRAPFPSDDAFQSAINQTADQMIAVMDQAANQTDGLRVKRNEQGQITETLVHRSLTEEERRVMDVLHDPQKFRAPFIVEIARREGLRYIVTEKDSIGSIIPVGQHNPHVEARTMRFDHPKTGERLLQQIFISTDGKPDNTIIPSGEIASSRDKLVNGFAHETIHNTPLDALFSKRIEKGEAAEVDKIIADDIAHLEAVDAKLKQALSVRIPANLADEFANISKAAEMNGELAPLFDLALEGFDKRTQHSRISAHDLREAVKANAIPSVLPAGLTAKDYVNGLREVAQTMSDHMKLPMKMMHYFPPSRYPDRKAVLNEYPGQVFSMIAIKGMAVTECLLPRLTPLLCDAVKQHYGIDPKTFSLPEAARAPMSVQH